MEFEITSGPRVRRPIRSGGCDLGSTGFIRRAPPLPLAGPVDVFRLPGLSPTAPPCLANRPPARLDGTPNRPYREVVAGLDHSLRWRRRSHAAATPAASP